eukprot:scaffold37661_cov17-Tisochrysis_lutea.AAC.1
MNKAEAMSSVDFCISCALTWWLWCATLPGCDLWALKLEGLAIYNDGLPHDASKLAIGNHLGIQ